MDLTKLARDAAYVAVGFGVLNFQRAQVRRRELTKQLASRVESLEGQLDEARGQVARLAQEVDERLEPMVAELEGRFGVAEEERLGPARDLVRQARRAARDASDQLRTRGGG